MTSLSGSSQNTSKADSLRRENLNRGVPALVIVAAALLLLLYGTLIVRPKVPQLYRDRCDQAMRAVGILDRSNELTDNDQGALSIDEQRSELNRINIYLNRLLNIRPLDALARFQTGLVAEATSKLYARSALEALRSGEAKTAESARSYALSAQTRAREIMEAVAETESPEANEAKAWLLSRALEAPVRDAAQLDRMAFMATDILETSPDNRTALGRLGQIRIQQAYSTDTEVDPTTRKKFVEQAIEAISKIDSPTIVEHAFLAEAQDATDVEASIQTAIQASQAYWLESAATRNAPERIVAMFSCLIRLGSLQEAVALVVEAVPRLSLGEQSVVRGRCSDFCLRNIVCQTEFPAAGRRSTSIQALTIATRLDPASPAVIDMMYRLALDKKSDRIGNALNQKLVESTANGLQHLVKAVRFALADDWTTSRAELQKSFELDGELATIGAALASRMVDEQLVSVDYGARFLEQMARVAPEAMNLWFARALFCEKHGQLREAAECLERILESAPKNPQILDFLEALYTRMNLSDDVARIQGLRSQLRQLRSELNR